MPEHKRSANEETLTRLYQSAGVRSFTRAHAERYSPKALAQTEGDHVTELVLFPVLALLWQVTAGKLSLF